MNFRRKQIAAILLGAIALPCCWLSAEAQEEPKSKSRDPMEKIAALLHPTRTVIYKEIAGRKLQLNIFDPPGFKAGDRRPCFLAIHGGGWKGGKPSYMYPIAADFAKEGMVGISITYRVLADSPDATVFDCVKDGRSAVRYVRSHAAELGIDPDKIIVCGSSAGGHIAAGTLLFDGIDEAGENTKVSCAPDVLILQYAVLDTSKKGYGYGKIGPRWAELSPLLHVRGNLPPTFVFHGTGDKLVPSRGSEDFHAAMLKAGNRCELVLKEGGVHGYIKRSPANYAENLEQTKNFLTSLGYSSPTAKAAQ
jgi:acetyl esterase